MLRAICLVVCVIATGGCTSTRLTEVWKSPDAPDKLDYSRIVVACLFADETSRRAGEDQLVERIGEGATPSYRLVSLEVARDDETMQALIERERFDGAVVMRLVSVDKERTWVPGTVGRPAYYDSFSGYYSYSWSRAYDAGRYETDTIVKIETVIYSLRAGQEMVWAAQSETFNPTSVTRTVKEIASAVSKRLRKDGLID